MSGIYDNNEFFKAYADMDRSKKGLEAAGEWHQLKPLFPDLKNNRTGYERQNTQTYDAACKSIKAVTYGKIYYMKKAV